MGPENKKTLLLFLLKFVVSGVLLVVIFKKAGIGNIVSHLAGVDMRFFALAAALYLIATFISAIRWGIFLGERYPLRRLFSLYMIGSFFNHVLPGVIGGDAVKIYYLYRDTRKGAASFGSVFMDRYIGFFGLLSVGLVAGLIAFRELETMGLQWVLPLLFALFLAGSMALFGLRMGRHFGAVAQFYDYFLRYVRQARVMVYGFLLSVVIQVLSILSVYSIALGVGQRPAVSAFFVFIPIIITAMSVPVSISGFGIREGAFVLLFGLIGIPPHVSASIGFLWFLSVATASLVGLVEYFRFRRNLQLKRESV